MHGLIENALLANISTTQLQSWLTEAITAYHDISIGGKVVTVQVTGGGQHREVTYDRTKLAQLHSWIGALQVALGNVRHSRRAIRPIF